MKRIGDELPIGYSAYYPVREEFEYNENHCYVAQSPESLREFMDGSVAPGERYRPGSTRNAAGKHEDVETRRRQREWECDVGQPGLPGRTPGRPALRPCLPPLCGRQLSHGNAVQWYERAIAVDTQRPDDTPYLRAAECYCRLGDARSAVEVCERCLRVCPRSSAAAGLLERLQGRR